MRRLLVAAVVIATAAGAARAEPSFDCVRAASASETAICKDENVDLAWRDGMLAALFDGLRAAGGHEKLVAGQKAWLRKRNACGADRDCLAERYDGRIAELARALGDTGGVTGAYGYAFGTDSDFGSLLVARLADGSLSGWISTVSGPTYHTCEVTFAGAAPAGGGWTWTDPETAGDGGHCRIGFAPSRSSIDVSSDTCRDYCGARGSFDARYNRQ